MRKFPKHIMQITKSRIKIENPVRFLSMKFSRKDGQIKEKLKKPRLR